MLPAVTKSSSSTVAMAEWSGILFIKLVSKVASLVADEGGGNEKVAKLKEATLVEYGLD